MSLTGTAAFDIGRVTDGELESGTSILLTGDGDAIDAVFYRLIAPDDDERTVVLATDCDGRTIKRDLDGIDRGLGDQASVLTCAGVSRDDDITAIEDISDLTKAGMEFSTLLAEAQQETDRFRAGINLCSSILAEVDDTRSVYRFLNSNFLTELRRGDGIGVCAIDTNADIGANIDSIIKGLETSFDGRIDVEDAAGATTIEISGLGDVDGTVELRR